MSPVSTGIYLVSALLFIMHEFYKLHQIDTSYAAPDAFSLYLQLLHSKSLLLTNTRLVIILLNWNSKRERGLKDCKYCLFCRRKSEEYEILNAKVIKIFLSYKCYNTHLACIRSREQ